MGSCILYNQTFGGGSDAVSMGGATIGGAGGHAPPPFPYVSVFIVPYVSVSMHLSVH